MMIRLILSLMILGLSSVFYVPAQDEFYHSELEWKTIETEHFFVHYHEGAERTARVVAKIAEEIYEPVTSLYNHKPDQKISFIIKDYDDFSNGAAYFYENKIEIWATSMDFDLRGTHNWLRNVVTHEFTHIIQLQTSMKFGRRVPGIYLQWLGYEKERRPDVLYGYPNVVVSYPFSGFVVPLWFAEGVAQFNRQEIKYDFWDSHRDMILRMYALDGNMLSWDEMGVFGKNSLGNEAVYNAGFAFVYYISSRFGENILEEISRNLASFPTLTIDGAIERATGVDGKKLYDEWCQTIKRSYREQTEKIRVNLSSEEILSSVGFANFYPNFSPDGKQVAYVSTKDNDYFSRSALFVYNLETKSEKLVCQGVRSNLCWSPDGSKIYYSKITRKNPYWSGVSDIFVYDLLTDEEKRLTYSLRASTPAVSPDGKFIVFVLNKDGTTNLFRMKIDGTDIFQLTHYENGEQVYNPKWSPSGKFIVFDYSIKDGRDIALISRDGGDIQILRSSISDERNATFTKNDSTIIYCSDKTGIFNLYRYNIFTKYEEQVTNVLGGAFMPSVNQDGDIVYSLYTSTGFKIALIKNPHALQVASNYSPPEFLVSRSALEFVDAENNFHQSNGNWKNLNFYNDYEVPAFSEKEYKPIVSSLMVVPFLRVDNYNPRNKGVDVIKPGVYLFSYDVLDRYGFIASAALNRKMEGDLFFIFDYRYRIPGLFQLGLRPKTSIEAYYIRRKSEGQISPDSRPDISIPVEITYSLLEFDLVMNQKIISQFIDLELRFAHSRYNASVGSFIFQDTLVGGPPIQIPASGNLYFIGNALSLTCELNQILPSRLQEINPVGRKVRFRYEYEFSKFQERDSSGMKYEYKDGLFLPLYEKPRFHRLELNWREYLRLPKWRHTLSAQIRTGTILGPVVDDFFDFYIGGLSGMKGYPYYSLGGNEFLHLNCTYRFPILEDINFRIAHVHFHHLYGAFYGDLGNAWNGNPKGQRYKRDIGVELRLETFSFYAYPTRIFFNATYGLDRFNRYVSTVQEFVSYGKEWQFHFGILFGFEFD